MPPPRTGSLEKYRRSDGRIYYRARIRLADGTRARVDVPEKYTTSAGGKTAEQRAELYAEALQEREDDTGELLAKNRANEARTRMGNNALDAFAEHVFQRREGEGKRSVGRERRMWKARVSERLGSLDVASVSKDQIEDFR